MLGKLITRAMLLFTAVVFASCNGGGGVENPTAEALQDDARDAAFSTISPAKAMNTLIILKLPPEFAQELKNGKLIALNVENVSSETIVFPIDYNVELFTYQEGQGEWVAVKDRNTYVSVNKDSETLLPYKTFDQQTGFDWQGLVSTMPYVSAITQPTIVRVVVSGEIYENGNPTGEKAGAYTDITLQP